MKRMMHETHGFHDAYTVQEEDFMRKQGWLPVESVETKETVCAKLDAAGITYDKRRSLADLVAMLP